MSIDELRADAAQIDAAATPQTVEGAAPEGAAPSTIPQPGNREAIAFMVVGFRELSCAMLSVESPRHTLDDAKAEAIGGALAPIADKYGLNLHSAIGGVEVQGLLVAGPILWGAYRALDAELKAKRAKEEQPRQVEQLPEQPATAPEADKLPPAGEAAEFAE